MKVIMLVCSAGMSTSLLVTKMKKVTDRKKIDVDIFASSAAEADDILKKRKIDLLLLGPQVKFMEKKFKKEYGDQFPIDVINMQDYGLMNGEKVLDQALTIIG